MSYAHYIFCLPPCMQVLVCECLGNQGVLVTYNCLQSNSREGFWELDGARKVMTKCMGKKTESKSVLRGRWVPGSLAKDAISHEEKSKGAVKGLCASWETTIWSSTRNGEVKRGYWSVRVMKERFDLKRKKNGGQRPPRLIEGGESSGSNGEW